MDFLKQQDAADPDFIPSEEDEKWRLEQEGEEIKRLHFLDAKKESARRNKIAKRQLKEFKDAMEGRGKRKK